MVKTVVQKIIFKNISANKLYSMYINSREHEALTGGGPAKISAKEGINFSAYDGYIHGKILRIIPNKLIVHSFIGLDWKKNDIDSILILHFSQHGKDAIIDMTHANIPDNQASDISKGWREFYWTPWKKYLISGKE